MAIESKHCHQHFLGIMKSDINVTYDRQAISAKRDLISCVVVAARRHEPSIKPVSGHSNNVIYVTQ